MDECISSPCRNAAVCSDASSLHQHADAVLTEVAVGTDDSGVAGYTTYRLSVTLKRGAESIYAIYGRAGHPLVMPAAYQVDEFGTDIGGVSPGIIEVMAEAGWDSWLTVGLTEGDSAGALDSVGLDFDAWTTDTGMSSEDGAVFFLDPDNAHEAEADGEAVIAQLTVPTGSDWEAVVNLRGRTADREFNEETGEVDGDWQELGFRFSTQ